MGFLFQISMPKSNAGKPQIRYRAIDLPEGNPKPSIIRMSTKKRYTLTEEMDIFISGKSPKLFCILISNGR